MFTNNKSTYKVCGEKLGERKQNIEFLTHETTCINEMAKKTTSEIICQKTPPLSGGTPGQVTRGTCRLGQHRHAPAANAISGTLPSQRRRSPLSSQVGHVA
jgi:hypothetical protein